MTGLTLIEGAQVYNDRWTQTPHTDTYNTSAIDPRIRARNIGIRNATKTIFEAAGGTWSTKATYQGIGCTVAQPTLDGLMIAMTSTVVPDGTHTNNAGQEVTSKHQQRTVYVKNGTPEAIYVGELGEIITRPRLEQNGNEMELVYELPVPGSAHDSTLPTYVEKRVLLEDWVEDVA